MKQLIQVVYNDLLEPSTPFDSWNDIKSEAQSLHGELIADFHQEVAKAKNKRQVKSIVQPYQSFLVDAINSLSYSISDSSSQPQVEALLLYQRISKSILFYILEHHFKFLRRDLAIPKEMHNQVAVEFPNALSKIQAKFNKYDSELFSVLNITLRQDTELRSPMSFGRYLVWKGILEQLEVMDVSLNDYRTFDCNIREVLMMHNFNAKSFIDFYKAKLDADLDSFKSNDLRMNRLQEHKKYVKQILPHKWLHYDLDRPSLIDAIIGYLKECEKLDEIQSRTLVNSGAKGTNLKTPLSPKRIMQLFMLLSEQGILTHETKAELAAWVTRNINKESGEPFSEAYLNKVSKKLQATDYRELASIIDGVSDLLEENMV